VHGVGQRNNFCACADNATSASCSLYFQPDASMWASFPSSGLCCRVCEPGDGCTTLRPDWLRDSTFAGVDQHSGCETWEKKGAVALDYWSQEPGPRGAACQYRESLSFGKSTSPIRHYLNFSSWSAGGVDPLHFRLPEQCKGACPRLYGKTCG